MIKLTLSFKHLERNLSTVIGSGQLPGKSTVQINDHFRRTAIKLYRTSQSLETLMEIRTLLDFFAIFDLKIFFSVCNFPIIFIHFLNTFCDVEIYTYIHVCH